VRLWLLRHAKSSWDDDALADVDRPLAPRGERAADAMATFIERAAIRPELVLCSPALRARLTLEHVRASLGEAEVVVDPELYTFDARPLLARVHTVPDAVASVMLVGHNPAMHELAMMLARSGDQLADLVGKYPTGALAELQLDATSWSAVEAGGGVLTRFVTPRTLNG
jgi:phosphohistidine phosphatase